MEVRSHGAMVILTISWLLIIYASCAAENFDSGMVTAQAVRLRAGPDRTAGILGVLNKGALVEVLETKNLWYKVAVKNGKEGWIYQDYITAPITEIQDRSVPLTQAGKLAEFAKSYLGFKYAYGGKGPAGFDCSGYTMFVYGKFGYKLPHSAASQMNYGKGIKRSELVLGDLIFFKTMRSLSINHVGIYLGEGSFIHAASGAGRIKIDSVYSYYYSSRYWGARRILVYEAQRNLKISK